MHRSRASTKTCACTAPFFKIWRRRTMQPRLRRFKFSNSNVLGLAVDSTTKSWWYMLLFSNWQWPKIWQLAGLVFRPLQALLKPQRLRGSALSRHTYESDDLIQQRLLPAQKPMMKTMLQQSCRGNWNLYTNNHPLNYRRARVSNWRRDQEATKAHGKGRLTIGDYIHVQSIYGCRVVVGNITRHELAAVGRHWLASLNPTACKAATQCCGQGCSVH